jgi:protein O-GlcNAc transferase
LGYYEWYLEKHYREGIEEGRYFGTPYDALSLCYQALKADDGEM